MNDIVAKPASPPDGSVVLGFAGTTMARKIDPDVARATAHALLAAADRAEHPRHDVYRSPVPPRPGQTVLTVDEHGHAVGSPRRVARVESKTQFSGQPEDKVWLDDGTGPFTRQIGFDVYRLTSSPHGPFYLAAEREDQHEGESR